MIAALLSTIGSTVGAAATGATAFGSGAISTLGSAATALGSAGLSTAGSIANTVGTTAAGVGGGMINLGKAAYSGLGNTIAETMKWGSSSAGKSALKSAGDIVGAGLGIYQMFNPPDVEQAAPILAGGEQAIQPLIFSSPQPSISLSQQPGEQGGALAGSDINQYLPYILIGAVVLFFVSRK